MSTHEVRELLQYHRPIISHLFILLPILFLTHRQTPYRAEIGRVGSRLLISLLSLRLIDERYEPTWIHSQYFGNLWTEPVQGRNTPTSLLAEDWADTLSIWIYPSGALSTRLGHRKKEEGTEATMKELQRESIQQDDVESQRRGLMLLQLLKTNSHTGLPPDDGEEDFMRILASSGDLLTSLTYAVSTH